jgi:hypothetical protein
MTGSDIGEPPLEPRASARINGDEAEEEQAETKKSEVVHERDLQLDVGRDNARARCKGSIRIF